MAFLYHTSSAASILTLNTHLLKESTENSLEVKALDPQILGMKILVQVSKHNDLCNTLVRVVTLPYLLEILQLKVKCQSAKVS